MSKRILVVALLIASAGEVAADWRRDVFDLALAGDGLAAELAERERAPWIAPHLAQAVPVPTRYVGWVALKEAYVVYRLHPRTEVRVITRPPDTEEVVAQVRAELSAGHTPDTRRLFEIWIAPISDWLDQSEAPWIFSLDGDLEEVPLPLVTGSALIHAASARSAALAQYRAAQSRRRPKSLFAFARTAINDPEALPAAHAEIALAAAALGGPATLLHGAGALDELKRAAHDGRLADARFVLFAAHAAPDPVRPQLLALQLAPGEDGRYVAADTLHLQFKAELVVLSACETALPGAGPTIVSGFAQAALFAGVGYTLLTQWRVDDAASAQFVAALFSELANGSEVVDALDRVQKAFRDGAHGDRYRAPYFWAAWQLWGG